MTFMGKTRKNVEIPCSRPHARCRQTAVSVLLILASLVSTILTFQVDSNLKSISHQMGELDGHIRVIRERINPAYSSASNLPLEVLRRRMEQPPFWLAKYRHYLFIFSVLSILAALLSFSLDGSIRRNSLSILILLSIVLAVGVFLLSISASSLYRLKNERSDLHWCFREMGMYVREGSGDEIHHYQELIEVVYESNWQKIERYSTIFLSCSFPSVLFAMLLHFYGISRAVRLRDL